MNHHFAKPPLVIDTNVLISAMISPNSIIHEAISKALKYYIICHSQQTLDEFIEVAQREKFLRFFKKLSERENFINAVISSSKIIEVTHVVTECKDPKDNMFLELALSCHAEYLVTGDKKDLIAMNPFRKIKIITARQFLAEP